MSEAMRSAYNKYLQIADMFRCGDPNAENAWRNFCNTENVFSLAMHVVNHAEKYLL